MKSRGIVFSAIATASLSLPLVADALPAVGSAAPMSLRIVDAYDRSLELKAFANKPILILYEDKDSSKLNQALKDELSQLAKGDKYRKTIALVPVADVSGYDFWPARGFVKDAIRDESKKAGTTIYCDWSGAFRRGLGLRGGTSSAVLVGRDGKVLFAKDGALDAGERKQLIGILRAQVEG